MFDPLSVARIPGVQYETSKDLYTFDTEGRLLIRNKAGESLGDKAGLVHNRIAMVAGLDPKWAKVWNSLQVAFGGDRQNLRRRYQHLLYAAGELPREGLCLALVMAESSCAKTGYSGFRTSPLTSFFNDDSGEETQIEDSDADCIISRYGLRNVDALVGTLVITASGTIYNIDNVRKLRISATGDLGERAFYEGADVAVAASIDPKFLEACGEIHPWQLLRCDALFSSEAVYRRAHLLHAIGRNPTQGDGVAYVFTTQWAASARDDSGHSLEPSWFTSPAKTLRSSLGLTDQDATSFARQTVPLALDETFLGVPADDLNPQSGPGRAPTVSAPSPVPQDLTDLDLTWDDEDGGS